eukprot:COSAG02_NODE_8629_length_2499_cov_4.090000_1_plen_284_part_00
MRVECSVHTTAGPRAVECTHESLLDFFIAMLVILIVIYVCVSIHRGRKQDGALPVDTEDPELASGRRASYNLSLDVETQRLGATFTGDPSHRSGSDDLWAAAVRGDLPMVKYFMAKYRNVDTLSPHGRTALFKAALGGHPDTVRWLLNQGACDPTGTAYLAGNDQIREIMAAAGFKGKNVLASKTAEKQPKRKQRRGGDSGSGGGGGGGSSEGPQSSPALYPAQRSASPAGRTASPSWGSPSPSRGSAASGFRAYFGEERGSGLYNHATSARGSGYESSGGHR